jgi:hypothetical protein
MIMSESNVKFLFSSLHTQSIEVCRDYSGYAARIVAQFFLSFVLDESQLLIAVKVKLLFPLNFPHSFDYRLLL